MEQDINKKLIAKAHGAHTNLQSALALEWVKMTGATLTSRASFIVFSDTCDLKRKEKQQTMKMKRKGRNTPNQENEHGRWGGTARTECIKGIRDERKNLPSWTRLPSLRSLLFLVGTRRHVPGRSSCRCGSSQSPLLGQTLQECTICSAHKRRTKR